MNKIKLAAFTTMVVILAACNKAVRVNLDIPGAASYSQLYMPQAAGNPISTGVSITDKDTDFVYSAYLGGPLAAKTDIAVNFSVMPEMAAAYNQQNGDSYKIMPEGSYTLQSASSVIPKGKQTTGALTLTIKTKGFINPFETYLLPVTLTQPGKTTAVNKDLGTTYYLFTGSYAPGEVPREKVYSFGANAGLNIFDFNGSLVREDLSGNLLLYSLRNDGSFNSPRQIGAGWNIFNLVFYYGGNRLIGRRTDNGNIFQYYIDSTGNFGASGVIGYGWNIFSKIIPYKGLLLGMTGDGNMTMYPLDANGNFDYGNIKGIGAGWNSFTQIIPYQNSLLAVEANGDMWQYPLTENGVFGSRKKVGSGWDMYTLVFASGTDLLALDSNGDLWRYKFNPAGLWPLK